MYIDYTTFTKYFPNVEITEDQFNVLEPVAEDSTWQYLSRMLVDIKPQVQFAMGLIIQNAYAMGVRPKELPKSRSEGGVNKQYKEFTDIIPDQAKTILGRYIDIDV